MLSRGLVLMVAVALFFPGTATFSAADDPESEVEALLSMLEGEYRTAEPDQRDPEEPLLCDRRVRVSAPQLGDHVIYMQINTGEEQKLYRQILMVFEVTDDGGISQVSWRLNDPAGLADQFDGNKAFAALSEEDVHPALAEGCEQSWLRKDDGWYGHTNPETCRIWSERRQMFRWIESEVLIGPDAMLRSERGFDDEGNQLFGTEPGEYYRLVRLPEPNPQE